MASKENSGFYPDALLNAIIKGDNKNAKLHLQEQLRDPWVDRTGKTLLHYSVEHRNVEFVQYLIDKKWDVNACDESGTTPLLIAVTMRDSKIINVLLKNNANIYTQDYCGVSPLQCAADMSISYETECPERDRAENILQTLIDIVYLEFLKDKDSFVEMLHNENYAVRVACLVFGPDELTKFILKNINDYRRRPFIQTPLHCAIIFAKVDKAKLLIDNGANIDPMRVGSTPLYYYIGKCEACDIDKELLKSLLTICKNWPVKELERLFTHGNKDTVKAVLQSGVELPALFKYNKTILHLLVLNRYTDAIDALDEVSISLNVNARDNYGATALYRAVELKHANQVEFLLRYGADLHLSLYDGHSILDVATEYINFQERRNQAAKITQLLMQCNFNFQDLKKCLIKADQLCGLVIISHLTLREVIGELNLAEMKSDSTFKNQFDRCMRQIKQMKVTEIHNSVTLFQLLTNKEKKVLVYAHNQEFVSAFNKIMNNRQFDLEEYYITTLHWRMRKATEKIKMTDQVSSKIEQLTGIYGDAYPTIVEKIMNSLEPWDLRNLCKI